MIGAFRSVFCYSNVRWSIVSKISRFVYCLFVLLLSSIKVVYKVQVVVGNGSVVFVLS